ncbi:MAG TPA: hypothetical protein VER79_00085 [Candidatus Limnocylindrales bacterium]|nr:hypothetical protein [Candidatus Limnocylindrales bacterium]
MPDLDDAILQTVLYGDVFNFPMTPREIHHFLIDDAPCSLNDVEDTLRTSPLLAEVLVQAGGYVALKDRVELMVLRAQREAASAQMMGTARRYGRWLSRLPFVRMVAITGALSMRNAADTHDDLDYVLVTARGRVWLARAFAIVIVRLGKVRGAVVCPNYVLAETALAQSRRDLYIAHEIAQMTPLYGFAIYEQMRALNGWACHYLPNARVPFYSQAEGRTGALFGAFKRAAEWLLGGRTGDALERWESARKVRRFQAQMAEAQHDAQLDSEHVKGHFRDHGQRVLHQYALRLQEYERTQLPLAGD